MEAINQLKTLRDEALQRLLANPDYRLLTSLDDLITDLESVTQGEQPKFRIVDDEKADLEDEKIEQADSEISDTIEEAFEKIASDIGSEELTPEVNELDELKPIVSFS